MILHLGERVYWGAPEVIYLEGVITRLDEATQTVLVHVDRATPNSSHLIGVTTCHLLPMDWHPCRAIAHRASQANVVHPMSTPGP
ncbi:MAG: hypothetical protein E6I32_09525 [Chloroflexi bacterium]|nr:MAG: hypothetical protein E6I32_09525 [Chloroflexota bacterium]